MWMLIAFALAVFFFVKWFLRRNLKMSSFPSRYIVVTGCDTGFGNALVCRLDELEFKVFAGCLTEEGIYNLNKHCTDNVLPIIMDVTKADHIERAVKTVRENIPEGTGLWGLVNNAGVINPLAPFEWIPRDQFHTCFDINLYGTIDVTRAFLPLLRMTPGRIINVSSAPGFGPSPTSISYSISKAGIAVFSEGLRVELYQTGITVHIIQPGGFATRFLNVQSQLKAFDNMYENLNPEVKEYFGKSYKEKMETSFFPNLTKNLSESKHKVVNSMVHALSARYPKAKYVVGFDANTVYRFIHMAPEWLADFLFNLYLPKPEMAVTS